MKIGIDCRLWNQTGVGRYIRNLVYNLAKLDNSNEYVLFVRSEDRKELKIKNLKFKVVNADIPWHSFREQISFPQLLNSQNLDLVHFPYFSIPIFYYRPFIVTVHDLIVNKLKTGKSSTLPYPLYLAKRAGYHAVLASALYRSKKIIVPSNAVAADLLKGYRNIENSKIEVTYEGGFEDSLKLKIQNSKFKIEGRYLLRVGNFYPHKNVENLLSAFKDFLFETYDNHDIKLILVGKKDFFYKRIERLVEFLKIGENIIFIDGAKDSELINLYKNALATIAPSIIEGFSLTAVEAMSLGSPVIVSDIPVHREICEDAAIYCNPHDTNDIKQKINFVCSLTESSRNELIGQGKKQAGKFSWKKMAEKTLNIYKNTPV
jgi:glycosyltransferase involved in cell wall biosynthesis